MKSLFIIASYYIVCIATSMQAKAPSNASKLHESIVKYASTLSQELSNSTIYLRILGNDEEQSFVKTSLAGALITNNISIITDSPDIADATLITIQLMEIGTHYSLYDDDTDSLIREIVFTCNTTVSKGINSQKQIKVLPQYHNSNRDIISRKEIDEIQQPGFQFCKGIIPQFKESFLSEFLQPIIFVSTAILSTYLLFSVRSK